jgi:hypothetical protein
MLTYSPFGIVCKANINVFSVQAADGVNKEHILFSHIY